MRVLDLFCGAGGASMGYHRASFEVVGVDVVEQPRYPFAFVRGDALRPPVDLRSFDLIHASPPCQAYSVATPDKSRHPDLYATTRAMLIASGVPWVIENVIGAPYGSGIVLCGSHFGLHSRDGEWMRRHRNFETSWLLFQRPCVHPLNRRPLTITGHAFVKGHARDWPRGHGTWGRQGTWEDAKEVMEIDWMNRRELVLSIPPAYTEWIGRQLLGAA
jgi:DNA (cytosine-5)-methyltransferase 1